MCGGSHPSSQKSQASSLIMSSPEREVDISANQDDIYRTSPNIMGM